MGSTSTWWRQLLLPCAESSPALARSFVRAHLHENGLASRCDDVELVVSELATNAVVHARTACSVRLAYGGGVLHLHVQDRSPEPVRPTVDRGADAPGGRGLVLVDAFSDAWGVRTAAPGAKTVWATFAVH
ncbi:ATP-binding protein [Aeromicrobium massiliense]|uniref:ATP-binding protein n=1 Tax=Aeromicrobium massiliense TaxID=1464554 RepID=UPI0002FFADC0|nr:ATP-binding protein [Aeromicrobium massiliense]